MRFRAPVFEDAPAVFGLLVARDLIDLGFSDYALGDLEDEWRGSELDLGADAQLVEAPDGGIVAYAIVRRPGAFAVVAPDSEGQGIGARLLGWVERRERQLGRDRHRQWAASSNARARALLLDAGYLPERSYWRMARNLAGARVEVAEPPAGIVLRSVDPEADTAALHQLDAISFAENSDHEPASPTAFYEEHLLAHDFDAALSYVAQHEGRAVGFLLSRRWEEGAGYVDLLAVHPDYRRQGLGTALLLRAFSEFASVGLHEAQLGVASDNPRALRLYERVGMTQRFRFDTYQRPMRH